MPSVFIILGTATFLTVKERIVRQSSWKVQKGLYSKCKQITALGFKFWLFWGGGRGRQSLKRFLSLPLWKKEFFGGSNFSNTSAKVSTISSFFIMLTINESLSSDCCCLCHQKCVDVWERNYNPHLCITQPGVTSSFFSDSGWEPHWWTRLWGMPVARTEQEKPSL